MARKTKTAEETLPAQPANGTPVLVAEEVPMEVALTRALSPIPATCQAIVPAGRIIIQVLGQKLTTILQTKQPELTQFQQFNANVTDDATCAAVSVKLNELKGWIKGIADDFEPPAEAFNKLHKSITSTRKVLLDPAEMIAKRWTGNLLIYRQKKEREEAQRLAAEQAEARRKADEAAKAAAEAARLAALDDDDSIFGDGPAVDPEEVAQAAAEEARAQVLAENAPTQVAVAVPMMQNTRKLPYAARPRRSNPDVEPTPEELMADYVAALTWIIENPADRMQFVSFNMPLLNTMARQHEAAFNIPGFEAFQGQTLR